MLNLEKQAHELTKALIDKGRIIEGGWVGLMLILNLDGVSPLQRTEMRKAFFAGADHLFSSILNALEPGSEPTEKDLNRLTLINNELAAFQKEFKDQYPLTK